MLKLLTGTLAACLLSAPATDLQDKRKNPPAAAPSVTLSFKALDLDGDGKVTKAEFMDAFDKLDRNHDGVISADEMSGQDSRGTQEKHKHQKPGKNKRKR